MSRKHKTFSLDDSFERAFRAASGPSAAPSSKSKSTRSLLVTKKGESKRRFIGKSQIDITYNGLRSLPNSNPVPWYVVVIAVGKIRHKFSLGAPANWQSQYSCPMDDALIDSIAQSAVRFAMDEGDDNVPDVVSDVVRQATDGHKLPGGGYTVRKTI